MFGLVALFGPYAATGWSLLPPSVTCHFIGLPIAQVDGVEVPGPAEGNPNPMGGLLDMLPLVIFLYVIFYVLMIRPQRKQQQQHDLLLKNLKQYDTVRTSGGIFGQVAAIDEEQDQVVLKVDEKQNVRMRVLRSSIVAVVGRGEQSSAEVATTAATGKPR